MTGQPDTARRGGARSARQEGTVEVTVAEPVLLPMSPQQRRAVVAALAELLAADLDHPAGPANTGGPPGGGPATTGGSEA